MPGAEQVSGIGGQAPDISGVQCLHHIAFASWSIDDASQTWLSGLGGSITHDAVLADQGVRAVSIELSSYAGKVALPSIELLEPLDDASPIARFISTLNRARAAFHHVAWQVDDLEQALAHATDHGIRLIDSKSRPGLHGTPIAFIHPSSTGGVLTELVQAH